MSDTRTQPATEYITALEEDWWVCVCGNEADYYGFVTCVPTGESIEPYGHGTWDGNHNRCEFCGRVARFDQRDPVTGLVPVLFTYPLASHPRCERIVARAAGVGACDNALPADADHCGSDQHIQRSDADGGLLFRG